MVDFREIITKHIEPNSKLYNIYINHVEQVSEKALEIGRNLKLNPDSMIFLKEASMLHDIGIVGVDMPLIHCFGNKPYFHHHMIGYEILMEENLPQHARVAANHLCPGTTEEDLIRFGISFGDLDWKHNSLEEVIIAYADMFSTKHPNKAAQMRTLEEVITVKKKYNPNIANKVFELSVEYGELSVMELQ